MIQTNNYRGVFRGGANGQLYPPPRFLFLPASFVLKSVARPGVKKRKRGRMTNEHGGKAKETEIKGKTSPIWVSQPNFRLRQWLVMTLFGMGKKSTHIFIYHLSNFSNYFFQFL